MIEHALWFCGFVFCVLKRERASKFECPKTREFREKFVQPFYENTLEAENFCDQKFSRYLWFSAIFWKIKAAKKNFFWAFSKWNQQNHGSFYAFYNCLFWKMCVLTHFEGQITVEIQIMATFIKWNKDCNSKDVIKSWSFLQKSINFLISWYTLSN